jgi:MFS family permease
MIAQAAPSNTTNTGTRASWVPLLVILLAQIQMAFNVTALNVSISGIVEDFHTSSTSVATALVIYSLAVAGFVMLGAKVGKRFGSQRVFLVAIAAHGAAMVLMALSVNIGMLFAAQAVAGLAAAAAVPTLVVLIAANYRGRQQAQALGLLAAAVPLAAVLAFLIAGYLGTAVSWRASFGLIVAIAAAVVALSFRLAPVAASSGIVIDAVGAGLAAIAITLISLGCNFLNGWGVLLAGPGAPFSILGASPAPLMIVVGIMFGQAFFLWTRRREAAGRSPLLPLALLDSREERAAIFSLLLIGAIGPAVNFLIPLYIQIVQGRSSLQTAVATIPYSLAIFAAASLVVRLYDRLTPRQIGCTGFVLVAVGLIALAYAIRNAWGDPLVIVSLLILGLGEGMLITIVFNVLVSASPKELAGDVGALRGTTNNLSTGLGTAIAAALAVGVLGALFVSGAEEHPTIPPALIEQGNFNNVDFVSDDDLAKYLKETTTATPEQIAVAVDINEDARLRALKISFLVLAGVALLGIIPASGLPPYLPDEVPSGEREGPEARREQQHERGASRPVRRGGHPISGAQERDINPERGSTP